MSTTETKVKSDTDRLTKLLKGLPEDERDDGALYADLIMDRLPRLGAKSVLPMVRLMLETVNDVVAALADYSTGGKVVMHKAHVPVSWIEYPNGRVGLDVVGNIAEVHLDDAFEVE